MGKIRLGDDFYERIVVLQIYTEPYSLHFQGAGEDFRLG